MDQVKPSTAFIGTAFVGTRRLGRPLTNAERKELASLLRQHDFVGASMVALAFAFKLRRNKARAQDLQGRAQERLIRDGWDPSVVTLAKCLCRFVWSEHTHERREDATRRKAEEGFLREQGLDHSAAPSVEDEITRLATENEEIARDARRLASLRAAFEAADDTVNLLYLKYGSEGIDEPKDMARLSGRDVRDFYLAADRRKRHAERLLAAERGAKNEENE